MANPTTPKSEPAQFTADAWAAGNGPLQVPLAGLLADQPELHGANLTHDEWSQKLDEYLRSERG